MGVAIALLGFWSILNVLRIDILGWITFAAAVEQVVGLIIICAALLTMSPSLNDSSFVFTSYFTYDDLGVNIDGHSYVGAIGLIFACYCFIGYDAPGMFSK